MLELPRAFAGEKCVWGPHSCTLNPIGRHDAYMLTSGVTELLGSQGGSAITMDLLLPQSSLKNDYRYHQRLA